MTRKLRIGAAALGGMTVGGAAVVAFGASRWNGDTARAVQRLTVASAPNEEVTERFSRAQLHGLPAPVARYFDFALAEGQPIVRRARVRQAGEFTLRPRRWSAFTAVQHFTTRPRAFVWDATIRLLHMLPVRVRDSYEGGEGVMHGTVAGLVPVVDVRGSPEMAAGSLVRWLVEAVQFPTALLPGEGLSWSAIDDSTARATLTDGATTVAADFRFGERGEVVIVSAMRHREVNGAFVLTPWVGRWSDYARMGGMMVPTTGEVSWLTPDGAIPYFRGRTLGIEYDPAAP